MKIGQWFLIGITLFVTTSLGFAKGHMTIDVEACAQHASHIVVVTEGDSIDGQLTILESWKGNLKEGDKLTFPEFQGFKEQTTRKVTYDLSIALLEKDTPPVYVSCSRMILFLQEKKNSGSLGKQWVGIASGDVIASTLWIEEKQAFAFYDRYKEEKGFLSYYSSDEAKIKAIIMQQKGKRKGL